MVKFISPVTGPKDKRTNSPKQYFRRELNKATKLAWHP